MADQDPPAQAGQHFDVTITTTHKVRVRVDDAVVNEGEDPHEAAYDVARQFLNLDRYHDRAKLTSEDVQFEVVEIKLNGITSKDQAQAAAFHGIRKSLGIRGDEEQTPC